MRIKQFKIILRLCMALFILGLLAGCGGGGGGSATSGGTTLATLNTMIDDANKKGDPDTDSDGLPDSVEAFLGTEPKSADTDGDGLFDDDEIFDSYGRTLAQVAAYISAVTTVDLSSTIPDNNNNGVTAPLDPHDSGDVSKMDGELVDSDGDNISNYLELYGYIFNSASGTFVKWDGDYTKAFFKTDPNQKSTDQDPFDDNVEVSGVNMDVSVEKPGDHPMVPALPQIVVRLEGYSVALNSDITLTEGQSLSKETNWQASTTQSSHQSQTHGWEFEATQKINTGTVKGTGIEFPSAEFSFREQYSGQKEWGSETSTSTSNGGSETSQEEWSNATSTNPSEAAKIKLFLKIYNQGTACASNLKPTLSLKIGGHSVATFDPGNAQVNMLQPGGVYPAQTGVCWVVEANTEGNPIYLTLDELKALESGAPISVSMTQMSAEIMSRNPSTGAYESLGDWNEYRARCEAISANLYFYKADGDFIHSMVYAPNGPKAPQVTLTDAIFWGMSGYVDENKIVKIKYRSMDGSMKNISLKDWTFVLDKATQDANKELIATENYSIFDLKLTSDSVILAKEPCPSTDTLPNIYYTYYDRSTGAVNAVVSDYHSVKTVQFKDKNNILRNMVQDCTGSSYYTYNPNADHVNYPSGYVFNGHETVVATNSKGGVDFKNIVGIDVTQHIAPGTPPVIQVSTNYPIVTIDEIDNYLIEITIVPNGYTLDSLRAYYPKNLLNEYEVMDPVNDSYQRPNTYYCTMPKSKIPTGDLNSIVFVAQFQQGYTIVYSYLDGVYCSGTRDLEGAYYNHSSSDCQWVATPLDLDTGRLFLDDKVGVLAAYWNQSSNPSPGNGFFVFQDIPQYELYIVYNGYITREYELRFNYNVLNGPTYVKSWKVTQQVLNKSFEAITKQDCETVRNSLVGTQAYTIAIGQIYVFIVETNEGRLAKVRLSNFKGLAPIDPYQLVFRATVDFVIFEKNGD